MGFMTARSVAIAISGFTATALISAIAPASAQVCRPLEAIGTEGTEVTKTVSPPSLLVTGDNWNTDFAVASGESYTHFIVNFLPQSGEIFDVDVNLKYSDDSIDAAYSTRDGVFPEGEPVTIRVESRVNNTPYQVNLRVGGLNAEGHTYRASISGCR